FRGTIGPSSSEDSRVGSSTVSNTWLSTCFQRGGGGRLRGDMGSVGRESLQQDEKTKRGGLGLREPGLHTFVFRQQDFLRGTCNVPRLVEPGVRDSPQEIPHLSLGAPSRFSQGKQNQVGEGVVIHHPQVSKHPSPFSWPLEDRRRCTLRIPMIPVRVNVRDNDPAGYVG